jgi:hypothetical protein
MRNRLILAALGFSFLLGLSPLAADPVIQRGIDVFTTRADGRTYYDFAQNPIAAGFFCQGSKAFTGRVAFKGLPLATGVPGQLWGGDTVVERLDDAAFDADGVAVTRLRMRALSLVSIQPINTACGAFDAYVTLAGRQRVTRMSIQRTQEKGGSFLTPLALDVKVTFIPVTPVRDKSARKLELTESFTFPATRIPWSFAGARAERVGQALVDTNGDLVPDTWLPGASNFLAGTQPERLNKAGGAACPCPGDPLPDPVCHASSGEQHCYDPGSPPFCQLVQCS